MSDNSIGRARPGADVVHSQAFVKRLGIPHKSDGEFNQGDQLCSPRKAECAIYRLPHRSYVVNSLKRTDFDFDEDAFARSSCLLFLEDALRARPDGGRNLYRTRL
jgi:hypothetical protein